MTDEGERAESLTPYRGNPARGTLGLDYNRGTTATESEMSKVHAKGSNLFSDAASSTIATDLESRLRELERNIAVAHEFIKLADESYSQVRHEWTLLQNDTSSTKKTAEIPAFSPSTKSDDEDTFQDIPSFKEKKSHPSKDKSFKSFGSSSSSHTPSLGSKAESTKQKETTEPAEAKSSEPQAKESKTGRHKKGKGSNSKN